MVTLDLSSADYCPDELRARVQAALVESETQPGEAPTTVKISEATYWRIQGEAPGMKAFADSDHDDETFFGLRLIRV